MLLVTRNCFDQLAYGKPITESEARLGTANIQLEWPS